MSLFHARAWHIAVPRKYKTLLVVCTVLIFVILAGGFFVSLQATGQGASEEGRVLGRSVQTLGHGGVLEFVVRNVNGNCHLDLEQRFPGRPVKRQSFDLGLCSENKDPQTLAQRIRAAVEEFTGLDFSDVTAEGVARYAIYSAAARGAASALLSRIY